MVTGTGAVVAGVVGVVVVGAVGVVVVGIVGVVFAGAGTVVAGTGAEVTGAGAGATEVEDPVCSSSVLAVKLVFDESVSTISLITDALFGALGVSCSISLVVPATTLAGLSTSLLTGTLAALLRVTPLPGIIEFTCPAKFGLVGKICIPPGDPATK